ncbi:hypothetical protein ACLI4R_07185 [Natrialbaceae archaeon A-chndr2]
MREWPNVACPVCDQGLAIGVPFDATVHAVAENVDGSLAEQTDSGGREKRRTITCPNGHPVAVTFTF